MRPPLVYVACPYGGDAAKLADAAAIVRQLNGFWGSCARFWAPWIDVCMCLTEADRERGLAFDLQAVALSHGVLAIRSMPSLSPGQQIEVEHAKTLEKPVMVVDPRLRPLAEPVRAWLPDVLAYQRAGR